MRAIIVACVLLCSMSVAAAAQCLEDMRSVSSGAQSKRLRYYLCNVGEARGALRIEFHRLVEPGASVLLSGGKLESLKSAFGTPRVIENAVAKELRQLSAKYGGSFSHGRDLPLVLAQNATSEELTQGSDVTGKSNSRWVAGGIPKRGKSASIKSIYADYNIHTEIDYPALPEIQHVMKRRDWPSGFKMFYEPVSETMEEEELNEDTLDNFGPGFVRAGLKRDIPFNVVLWRAATRADLVNYPTRLRELNAFIARRARSVPRSASEYDPEPYVEFLKHITRDGAPTDFLTMVGEVDQECVGTSPLCCWKFSIVARAIALNFALIRNVSKEVLKIEALHGSERSEYTLRRYTGSSQRMSKTLEMAPIDLKPDDVVLVPLSLMLINAQEAQGLTIAGGKFGTWDTERAWKLYNRIHATPAGSVYKTSVRRHVVEKVRESFLEPSKPAVPDYIYGPEVGLTGLTVRGTRIDLGAPQRNILALTIGEGYGSCPYVYSWSPAESLWTKHGKLLHWAQGREKAQRDGVEVDGLRLKWRVAEQEPEVAYIDEARLILSLKSKRSIAVRPNDLRLRHADGSFLALLWGEHVDIQFKLPPGITRRDVVSSRLDLTGYYDRYGLLAAK